MAKMALPWIVVSLFLTVGCSGQKFTVKPFKAADLASSSTPQDLPVAGLEGAKLYAQHCALCHNPLETSRLFDRTAAQILASRTAIPSMAANPGIMGLTSAEIEAIALALKTTTSVPGANPFFCQATAQPPAQRLQRLSKDEYVNTLRDLFKSVVAPSEWSTELAQFPEEANQDNPFDRGADSLNLGIVKAHNEVSSKIATLVTSTTAKMNTIFSESCFAATSVTDACLISFINRFGTQVYRRPVKAAEQAPLMAAYRLGDSRAESSGLMLRAFLMSPNFLYHIENDGTPIDSATSALNLSSYELASRLSYMAIGSMPDSALMATAADGSIMQTAVFDAQMKRLLALPDAKTNMRRFFSVWLDLGHIRQPAYTTVFKAGIDTTNLNADAVDETLLFTNHIVFEGKRLGGLLTDNTAYITSTPLAQIYGVSIPASVDGKTTLPAAQRGGVLTRVARTLSGNNGTSPILRGVTVRRNLMCDVLVAPNPASLPPGSLNAPPDDPLFSTRQRFENKTSPAACVSCHSRINPIGYALENYDALGRFRTTEQVYNSAGQITASHPVDAHVTVTMTMPPDLQVNGALDFSAKLADSSQFKSCFSKKWFQYSMRRSPTALDNCMLAKTYETLDNPQATLMDAMKALMNHSEFKMRRMK